MPTLEQVLKERVTALIGDDLAAVEAEIRREIASPVALIQEMGGYIAGAGGKRLRPILLLLASRLAGYRGPRAVRLACGVELLHTATLIHDDVVDDGGRGLPAPAQAERADGRGGLRADHHPEDRLLHVRVLPHRRPAGRRVRAPAGRAHALRARHRRRLSDVRRLARLRGRRA